MITKQELAEGEELLKDLEALQEGLPWIIFIVKMGIAVSRRELREAGLGDLLDQVHVAQPQNLEDS